MKKSYLSNLGLLFAVVAFFGCEYNGIDPITAVAPGPDAADPQITIHSPLEGTTLKVAEPVTAISINFEVVDDIEVKEVSVAVDDSQIANFTEFKDYRVVKEEVTFSEVINGEHTITITATDVAGNSSTQTVNFTKEPPYTPRFANEFFYVPFDGAGTELVTITEPEETGTIGFTSDSYLGTAAYLGATDSYLEYPLENPGTSFSAAFWYKLNADPGRAGILVAGDDAADRNQGFRLFREGDATQQTIKLNIGTGTGEAWNNGSTLDPTTGEWVHIAFTVSPTESVLYFNGVAVATAPLGAPIDWTGVSELTVGSGGETFNYWDHLSDLSSIDELRLFNTALTQTDIQNLINASAVSLYMPFDGQFKDLIANREVSVVGNPGFATESIGGSAAYKGALDSYLTLPSTGLTGESLSATFWYNVNTDPTRAGILVVSPEDPENPGYPETQNIRTKGFRLLREGTTAEQRIKLNVGTGTAEVWNDGGLIDPASGWVHVAFTISPTQTKIYLDGVLANTASLTTPVDWTGTDILSVMSGAPRFTGWNHLSDTSILDELRFYNKELTLEEIQAAMAQ